jgi:hypothetical protein
MTSSEPVRAELRVSEDGLKLWVNPVELEALAAARADGGRPAEFCPLPDIAELPLRLVVLEMRVGQLEQAIYGRGTTR